MKFQNAGSQPKMPEAPKGDKQITHKKKQECKWYYSTASLEIGKLWKCFQNSEEKSFVEVQT